jgi:PleD family two-component response regulator
MGNAQVTVGAKIATSAGIMVQAPFASPRVLVVGANKDLALLLARSLDLVGHRVTHHTSVTDVTEAVRAAHADAVVLEATPSDIAALDACRRLRDDLTTSACPVLLVSPYPFARLQRIAVLKAGAWHAFAAPIDADEVRLRIERYVSVRRHAQRMSENSLIDPDSGLYNAAGLARRGRELGQQAIRQHWALSCVVLSAELSDPNARQVAETRCAAVLRHIGRVSDVCGRLGPLEYLVLAPTTNEKGAGTFARRVAQTIQEALQRSLPPGIAAHLRVGFASNPNLGYQPMEPTALLARAATALRGGVAPEFSWITPAREHAGVGA